MNLRQIQKILDAKVVSGSNMLEDIIVKTACGADLMSDVLAFTKEKTLLLTGLTNIQVVRTAEVSDLSAIIFVRGKTPNDDVVKHAIEQNIPLLSTKYTLYEACGLLYQKGIPSCPAVKGELVDA